ncbi:snaclec bothroinsularin subunit alpha-like [Lineus longissimus]|uniref:snaclec bothroinsularin subunit alpha-like n=1 Tax=Lineus longissimus TaxID=88925 RepID=UPI00315D2DB9
MAKTASFFLVLCVVVFINHINAKPGCQKKWRPFNRKCYKFFAKHVNFTQAEKRCRHHALGGHLASINSMEEFVFLLKFVRTSKSGIGPWVGIIISGGVGARAFHWTDTSSTAFRTPLAPPCQRIGPGELSAKLIKGRKRAQAGISFIEPKDMAKGYICES